jgi:uncharacterized cupredoxin-like copper-binding protein
MRALILTLTAAIVFAPVSARAHENDRAAKPATPEHAAALGVPGDPKAKARTVAVGAGDNMRFTPQRITVKRGETIRFVLSNGGELKHEMVLGTLRELREHAKLMQRFPEMEHEDPNAAQATPGQSADLLWKFTRVGEFHFGCLLPGHFESGMRGTIVVTR